VKSYKFIFPPRLPAQAFEPGGLGGLGCAFKIFLSFFPYAGHTDHNQLRRHVLHRVYLHRWPPLIEMTYSYDVVYNSSWKFYVTGKHAGYEVTSVEELFRETITKDAETTAYSQGRE